MGWTAWPAEADRTAVTVSTCFDLFGRDAIEARSIWPGPWITFVQKMVGQSLGFLALQSSCGKGTSAIDGR